MEGDGLGLDLALLHVDLVAAEDDGDVLANADKITCDLGLAKTPLIDALNQENVRCQLGTFLYVMRDVTSNMMIPHCPLM